MRRRDKQRVLAGTEHTDHPINGGLDVAGTEAFVEGGNEVVVLFAGGVVDQLLALGDLFDLFDGDAIDPLLVEVGGGHGHFQKVEGAAGVAVGHASNEFEHAFFDANIHVTEAAFFFADGVFQDHDELIGG